MTNRKTIGAERLRDIARQTWRQSCAPQRHLLEMADQFDALVAENERLRMDGYQEPQMNADERR